MKSLAIALHFIRASIITQAQYRVDFLLQLVLAAFWVFWNVAPFWVMFELRPTIAGWHREEAALVLSGFLILKALLEGLVMPNLNALVQHIRVGTFDFVLLKPADPQLLVSFSKIIPAKLVDFSAGAVIAVWSVAQLEPNPGAMAILYGLVMLFSGAAAIYGIWIALVCTAFWWVKVDNLSYLFSSIFDAARWPVNIFRGWLRFVLTFVLPVALMTSYPAMAILGQLEASSAAYALALATTTLFLSRKLWRWALGHYASASS